MTTEYVTQFDAMPGEPTVIEASSQYRFPDEWFFNSLAIEPTHSGVRVNPKTAMGYGPVWQAINILAGDMGQLPLEVMRIDGRKKEHDPQHPVDWLLNEEPNSYQTAALWKETMLAWALGWGNGCSLVVKEGLKPVELLPMLPDRTRRVFQLGQNWIVYTDRDQNEHYFHPSEVFHIRGLASDGFWGLSAVTVCKNVIGHGLAMQEHGNRTFANDATPRGIIKHPSKLSPKAVENIRREYQAMHMGVSNAGKVGVLGEGAEFEAIGMSNQDAEWLSGRRFNRQEIASLFNLPCFKLNALEDASVKANVEEQNRGYYASSLSRWGVRFKEETKRTCFTPKERSSRSLTMRVVTDPLTQGNRQSRMTYASSGVKARLLTRNEGREELGLNPVDGGDEFENPAIDTNKAKDQQEARDRARDMVRSQVGALLKFEAGRVRQVVDSSKLATWAQDFYAHEFQQRAAAFLAEPVDLAAVLGHKNTWQAAIEHYAEAARDEVVTNAGQYCDCSADRVLPLTINVLGGLSDEGTVDL